MSALTHGLNAAFLRREVQSHYSTEDTSQWSPPRKAPQRESVTIYQIADARTLLDQSRDRVRQDINKLKLSYVFADAAVDQFLTDHRALPGILHEAVEPLRASFGADPVFRLEVSIDEDDSKMLYGIVLWHDTVRAAAQALDNFDETWWLDHMTTNTADLAFIYRIYR